MSCCENVRLRQKQETLWCPHVFTAPLGTSSKPQLPLSNPGHTQMAMPYGIWGAGDTSQTPYVKMKSDETLFPTANCCSEALVCSRLWTLRALAFPSFFCGDLQLQEGVPVTAWAPALTKEGKWTDPQLPASSGSDPLPPPAPAQFSAPGFCIFNSGQNVISLKLLALSCCYLNYKSAPSPCHSRVIFSFW